MGAGGRLPVSVNPSTGNIVVLGFHPQEGLRETQFQSFEVEFVSRGDAREFLGYLKQKAEPLIAGADLRQQLARLQFEDLEVWEKAKAWASETRQKEAQKYELVDLMRRTLSVRVGLPGLRTFAPRGAGRGGRGDCDGGDGSSNDVSAYRTLSAVQFPAAPAAFNPQADRLDATRINGLFPLIRSVRIEVQVPSSIATRLGSTQIPRLRALMARDWVQIDRACAMLTSPCGAQNIETLVIVVDASDPAPGRHADLRPDARCMGRLHQGSDSGGREQVRRPLR